MEAVSGSLPNHPFLLRTSVEGHLGTKIEGAFPEQRGITYALKVRGPNQVQKLVNMSKLNDGTPIRISKHPILNTTRCVVSCYDSIQFTDDQLKAYLADQKVTDLRRITRKNGDTRVNTSTIILTIEGTRAPEYVDFGWLRCRTRPFYPAPMMCFQCWSFGHTKSRCQQPKPTCGNCAKTHETQEGVRCQETQFCSRCKNGNHPLSSRKCPVYIWEENIQKIRVDRGVSYPAAKKMYEQAHCSRSFAGVASAGKDEMIATLSEQIAAFRKELEEKDARIKALEANNIQNNPPSDDMLATILAKVDLLSEEIKKKDRRIFALEQALAKSNQEREANSTLAIQVRELNKALAQKDQEILSLRNALGQKEDSFILPDTPAPTPKNHQSREHDRKVPTESSRTPSGNNLKSSTSTRETRSRSRSNNQKRDADSRKDSRSPPKKEKKKSHTTTDNSKQTSTQKNLTVPSNPDLSQDLFSPAGSDGEMEQ